MHARPCLPPALLVLGAMVSAAGVVGAQEKEARVRHQLEVETGGGKVRVRLLVENRGDTTIYIPREVAAGDEITGRRFDLRDAKGDPVGYTGMMVKRGALTAADYQPVESNTMHMNTIDITPSYAFKKGRQGYEIRYDGPWLADVARLDAVQHSPAAPVKFSFSP
ncbi:hypothetical protein [Massilia sp. BSC265]|uniref:hypothetical protein n=1 Tax=Massilia sp. BSC265 TaxID=1549812 RepID=UPI0004E88A59|nr:hypothetical protein [Massilia sp. BSC265]KFI08753.1 hypothetical protein JN27_00930 [Massilia sp. BSC265]